jgi:hypothetical protein
VMMATAVANRMTAGREDFCNCILRAFILCLVPFSAGLFV